jgi:hypothetical protein
MVSFKDGVLGREQPYVAAFACAPTLCRAPGVIRGAAERGRETLKIITTALAATLLLALTASAASAHSRHHRMHHRAMHHHHAVMHHHHHQP